MKMSALGNLIEYQINVQLVSLVLTLLQLQFNYISK